MIRQKLTMAAVATAFAFSLSPAGSAEGGQAGSRPSNGDTTGTAQPRGGESSSSSGSSSSGSSSSGSDSGGASSGGTSSGGSSSPSGSWMGGSSPRSEAPRSAQRERQPSGQPQGRAVPRGSGGSSDRAATRGTADSAGADEAEGRSRAPVPAYSRPRDGRTSVGAAAEREGRIPTRGGGDVYYPGVFYDPYYSYYDPYYGRSRYSSYWSPYGYGYGFGYFSYDPFLFDPYGSGYGYGGYAPGAIYSSGQGQRYGEVGSLRLKVKPNHAQVFIDGYYVGVIDSFDGVFQRLGIEAGAHRVEVRADGYESVQFEVMVTPGETITYKGELKRIQ